MMRELLLIVVSVVMGLGVVGQTVPDKTSYDFGELYGHSDRFVDIYFKNTGEKNAFFLRLDKLPEVTYRISGSTFAPDSSIAIRFQVNPKKKGRFTYAIPVYFSNLNEPITVKLKGEVVDLPPTTDMAAFQNCPDFTQNPGDGNPLDFTLTVVTVEKGSGKVLSKSDVALLQNGQVIGQWKTDRNGKIVKRVPLGYSYFYGAHDGYVPAELGAYINFRRNYIVLELEKREEDLLVVEQDIQEEEPQKEIVIEIEEEPENEEIVIIEEPDIPQEEITFEPEEEIVTEVPGLGDIPLDNFDPTYFKPNNLVFVLDVSTSMRAGDRFELLKYALYQLMDYIRPEDKIALVTYGSDARVVLPTTKGSNKDRMKKEVEDLKASGFTAGGKGIKLGYSLAKKGFIQNGNNQVFVITDGAFNRDSEDYERYVKRYTKEGYKLSVVGIKNAPKDESKMREVAELGNGRYVPVFKLSDAQWNLIHEIREASFKGQ